MPLLRKELRIAVRFACLIAIAVPAMAAQRAAQDASQAAVDTAKVIILGSGTPIPDPSSSGPCVAVVFQVRTGGMEGLNDAGLAVRVHEIEGAGLVYKDENLTVRAIEVKHGTWPQALGYVIEAGGRRIVISGDTQPTQAIVDACHG